MTCRRVLRFDSFAKILSAGARIGWCTGPPQLIEKLVNHQMVTTQHPSCISQQIFVALFRKWGVEGFFQHVNKVRQLYVDRRDACMCMLSKHFAGSVPWAEWQPPQAGMFVWIKLLNNITDSSQLIQTEAIRQKVLLVPGVEFYPLRRPTPYVRISFSSSTLEDMNEAISRLAKMVRDRRPSLSKVRKNSRSKSLSPTTEPCAADTADK
jgi:DNA-binding transcriptional MocR family regulator